MIVDATTGEPRETGAAVIKGACRNIKFYKTPAFIFLFCIFYNKVVVVKP